MNEVKPGYLTTEFYALIANTVLSILVVAGVIGKEEKESLYALIVPMITAALGFVAYILSRAAVKRAAHLS